MAEPIGNNQTHTGYPRPVGNEFGRGDDVPEIDIKQSLIEQMTFAWDFQFSPRMEGLATDEYLWEPVADVWTVHPGENGAPNSVDLVYPGPDPAPFTTIAWRMFHMTSFFNTRWSNHFGDGSFDIKQQPVRLTAEEGMADLTASYERWRDSLQVATLARFEQECGPAEGMFASNPFSDLVLHINREFIHHAAECSLIRDLYRQRDSLG